MVEPLEVKISYVIARNFKTDRIRQVALVDSSEILS